MSEDDVDIMCERSDQGWIARIIHRPTGTIKISDYYPDKESAIKSATEGLFELLKARLEGLGEKK